MKMFFMSHEIKEFENSISISISWLMKNVFMSHEIEPLINVFFSWVMKNCENGFHGMFSWCIAIRHDFQGKFMAHESVNFYFHGS